jgi:hypothetical protein
MRSQTYFALILAAAFLVTGCRTFEGRMDTKEKLTFNERKNNVVEVGQADAKLKIDSKEKVILEVSKAGRNNNPKITFKIPKHEELPTYDGAFELTAAQTGQPYDVKGDVRTSVSRGPERGGTESCRYYDRVERCVRDEQGRERCRWEQVERTGERCIRYYDEQTIQDLVFDLYKPNTQDNVSQFDGQYSESRRVVTWTDYRCEEYARFCR